MTQPPDHGLLRQPVPIIFAVVQGYQQLANGALNLLGIFDRLAVTRMPDGTPPTAVTLQVVTIWTGGVGQFTAVVRLLDEDGNRVSETTVDLVLPSTSHRHLHIAIIQVPVREGVQTMTVGRSDMELLRQDFTIEIVPFPTS